MHQDWQTKALERLFGMIEAGEQDMVERTGSVAAANYASRERLEQEQRHVFRKYPLLVGFSAQIRSPGDFFTHDLAGAPVVVTRDREGTLRAFLNVCRHRGAKVELEPCGSRKSALHCSYHGWSYGLDGKLAGVPHPSGFPGLIREERGLVPLPVAETCGLVFVCTTPGSEVGIREFIAPVADQLESLSLTDHVVFESSTRFANANWKLMIDANLETYHISTLHRQSAAGPLFLDNLLMFDALGPHTRLVLPFKSAARPATADSAEWRALRHGGVLYHIFPNTFVFFLGPLVHVLTTFPVDEDRCAIRGATLVRELPAEGAARDAARFGYDGYWETILEDIRIAESIQVGVRSGVNREFITGRYEFPIERFHSALDALIQGRAEP